MKKQKRKWTKIKHIMPSVGTELIGRHNGEYFKARVVELAVGKEGKGILYKGNVFPSMTAAAKVITGNSTNGWRFWKISI